MVEHDLAKVGVEGPSPFSRSKIKEDAAKRLFLFCSLKLDEDPRPLGGEGATKFFRGRSPWEEFRIYRVAINPEGGEPSA